MLVRLIDEYDRYLSIKKGRARSDEHRARVKRCLGSLLHGAERIEDVTPEWIEVRLYGLLGSISPRTKRTLSRNTVATYRCVLGTFLRWLCKKRRLLRENPIEFVESIELEDARGASRAFSPCELKTFWPAVPRKRVLIYATWATTGLRPSETRRLPWHDVILDPAVGMTPHFVLRGSITKNRKPERQPLHPQLVTMLRRARDQHPHTDRVFPSIPTSRTFAEDLRRAGLWSARETAEGKLTRYSLRKTFITAIVSDEKNSQVAHKLARHSDPKLTYGAYTTFDLRRKADAVLALDLLPSEAA